MQNKIKVLMLGWEFPPFITGGLGVACQSITNALSKNHDIILILPKVTSDFASKNVETIGMNKLDTSELIIKEKKNQYSYIKDISYVQANVMPYQSSNDFHETVEVFEEDKEILVEEEITTTIDEEIFNSSDLYGGEIGKRVYFYAKLATEIALKKDFDVIHAHDWMTFVAGQMIKAATGKPLILHVHSLEVDRNGVESKNWIYDIEKAAFEVADAIIPVSYYTASMIEKYYSIPSKNIFPVHNGIEIVKTFRSESNLPEKVVLFLGRITHQKGPDYFLEIASKVLEYMPNVRFVMAGSGDKMKEIIEKGAYKHIGNRFHFTGFLNQEKVRYLYSIADVYVMPSVSEPFGLSALEAAQFGIPCVISQQSGVAEVLHGALKADFWDVDKFSGNIISLLKYKGLRDQVVKDAFKDLNSLTWEANAEKISQIYQNNLIFA